MRYDCWNIKKSKQSVPIISMKDGTGLELLEDIRQKGITVPFLLMSGDDDCLLEQKAKLCGGVFCSKVDYDLIEKIKSIDSH